jgi:hypothetical protein
MKTVLNILFLFILTLSGYSADYVTTAVAGTWSPVGPPTFSSDNITVNHDWSAYNNPIFNNYTGTLTINAGGYLKVNGTFTTWHSSSIIIAATGTLQVTGGTSFNFQYAAGWGTNVVNNLGTIQIDGDFANYHCDRCTTCGGGGGQPACNADPDCHWTNNGTVTVVGNYSGNGLCAGILPVELIFLSTETSENGNVITWQTGSEINNDYFEIERSFDAKSFETIAIKNGAGNSTTILNYSFVDTNSPKSNSTNVYYRLKQVDFDGAFTYSPISVISNDLKSNVIQNEISKNFKIIPAYSDEYQIVAYGIDGHVISREIIPLEKGSIHNFNINYKGAYTLIVTSKHENTIKKGIINF